MLLLKPALTAFLICSFSLTTIIYADKCWANLVGNTIQIAVHKGTKPSLSSSPTYVSLDYKNQGTNISNDILSPKSAEA